MDSSIYNELIPCPICGAPVSKFHKDGSYERDFICYENGTTVSHKINIRCVECSSCGHSYALEPSVIIPYSSFSIGFLLGVIYAKISCRFRTVLELCTHFDISISTYYRILKKYMTDVFLLGQLIGDAMSMASVHKCSSFSLHQKLRIFFYASGYSFLQPCVRMRPNIQMNALPTSLSRYIGNGCYQKEMLC